MDEWKRFGIVLLIISILFFLIVDVLMYQSITEKNIKLHQLEKNIETLNRTIMQMKIKRGKN